MLRFKLGQFHAPSQSYFVNQQGLFHVFRDSLVKLTVIDSNGGLGLGLLPGLALAVHRDLVINPELALRHPGQVGLHQDLTRDVSGQNLQENVQTL